MNDISRELLRDQIAKDTIWCGICAFRAVQRRADVIYTVASDGVTASMPACRECFHDVLNTPSVPVVSSQPVSQPKYIDILETALR